MSSRSPEDAADGRASAAAFTLVELLVTFSLLSLLAGLAVPCFRCAMDYALCGVCQHNLHTLAEAVHTCRAEAERPAPPPAETWADWLRPKLGTDQPFCCPCDEHPVERSYGKDQLHLKIYSGGSYLYDIYLFDDHPVYQTSYGPRSVVEKHNISGDGRTYDLFIEDLLPQEADWDWDVCIRIVEGDTNLSATIIPGSSAGYRHYLYRGSRKLLDSPVKNYEQERRELLLLTNLLPGSYGMNSALPATPEGRQLLLLDYKRWVADHDGKGNQDDDLQSTLAPRHLGRLNLATFDGAVRAADPGELIESEILWTGPQ